MNLSVGQAWAVLVVAGLFEIAWALGLKYSDGFSKLWPSVVVVVAAAASFWLLASRCSAAGQDRLCGLDRHQRGRNSVAGDCTAR